MSMSKPAAQTGPDRRLLLSIHDVGPMFETEIDRLRSIMTRYVAPDRVALLVVPNHWGRAPLIKGSAFASRLRRMADEGAEVFVHGWFHRDDADHPSSWARFKASRFTAREGEFLGISYDEALTRMRDGRALVEDLIGKPASGFVAPAWLYGTQALKALRDTGYGMAEDHWKVWDPRDGRLLCRGPVLTWASRTAWRRRSSLAVARVLPLAFAHMPVARVAAHPGDVGSDAIIASLCRVMSALLETHRPGRYAELARKSFGEERKASYAGGPGGGFA